MMKYQLLPDHEFQLNASGDGAQRFVAQFRDCWERIPISARHEILAYWKKETSAGYPRIELSDMWGDSETNFAQVRHMGMELRFSAHDFLVLPDSIAHWVIAHELAHVFQKTAGKVPGGANEAENERDADVIAMRWGFAKSHRTLLAVLMQEANISVDVACQKLVELGLA